MKKVLFLITSFFFAVQAVFGQADTLHVYGPGGPFSAINECAVAFTAKTGVRVKVIAGPEPKWIVSATQNADVVFEGAEYMMPLFVQNHPGMVDEESQTELYRRAVAILVRPGNPKHIRSLKDLTQANIHILDVNGAGQLGLWEDLAGRQNLIAGIRANIKNSYPNTALGIEAWKNNDIFDAWITYSSWHRNLPDITEIVELPERIRLYRGTPIALTRNSYHKQQAKQFITFLKSEEGHAIFRKWGWE